MGVSAQGTKPHLAIAAWEWGKYFDPKLADKGIRLDIARYRRPAPPTAPGHSKAAGLDMICTLSRQRHLPPPGPPRHGPPPRRRALSPPGALSGAGPFEGGGPVYDLHLVAAA